MTTTNFDFQCPTCKRNLGMPDALPENCPRCGTPLASLQEILQEAINFYRIGCQAVRNGNYDLAQENFEEAANLWDTEMFRRSRFFAGLLQKQANYDRNAAQKNAW